jgi:hypothetical protein
MTRAAIERRIAEVERQVSALSPAPAGLEWIAALTDDELDELEELYRRHAEAGTAPSDAERLWALSIYTAALARMVAT